MTSLSRVITLVGSYSKNILYKGSPLYSKNNDRKIGATVNVSKFTQRIPQPFVQGQRDQYCRVRTIKAGRVNRIEKAQTKYGITVKRVLCTTLLVAMVCFHFRIEN